MHTMGAQINKVVRNNVANAHDADRKRNKGGKTIQKLMDVRDIINKSKHAGYIPE